MVKNDADGDDDDDDDDADGDDDGGGAVDAANGDVNGAVNIDTMLLHCGISASWAAI